MFMKNLSSLATAILLLHFMLHTQICGNPIRTIVILVMENRSFDHMLGWMKSINPEIDGVDGSEYNLANATDTRSARFFFKNTAHYVDPDPGHSFQAIREQIFGGDNDTSKKPPPMNGFAQQAFSMDASGNLSAEVMNGFQPSMVAVYQALVSEFAVFDRWFASVPSSTQPNRLYVHSATSAGATSNAPTKLIKGYPQRTIFDNLHDAGISWGVYYQNIPATLFYRNLRKLKYISKFHLYGQSFKKHARQGKLPMYVVVEQQYVDSKIEPANDDHPSHDIYQGQMFVKEVYEILRASPQWNETLLVITYDEHGGFFDHVATPTNGIPSPDGIMGSEPFFFKFDRLGVRVPTIMVSPWIQKGSVVHGPTGSPFPTSEYEHSSIPATVKKLFNLPHSFLTKRDEWAATFEHIVQNRTQPRTDCPERLPTPSKIREGEANEEAKLSIFQQELLQLAAALGGEDLVAGRWAATSKEMTVKQGKPYMEDAVKRFFQAGLYARKLGVSEEQIVHMRPSLTTRSNRSATLTP